MQKQTDTKIILETDKKTDRYWNSDKARYTETKKNKQYKQNQKQTEKQRSEKQTSKQKMRHQYEQRYAERAEIK